MIKPFTTMPNRSSALPAIGEGWAILFAFGLIALSISTASTACAAILLVTGVDIVGVVVAYMDSAGYVLTTVGAHITGSWLLVSYVHLAIVVLTASAVGHPYATAPIWI